MAREVYNKIGHWGAQVMASNLSRLNMAQDVPWATFRSTDASCGTSPMQTDSCNSPTKSDSSALHSARSQEGETTSYMAGQFHITLTALYT